MKLPEAPHYNCSFTGWMNCGTTSHYEPKFVPQRPDVVEHQGWVRGYNRASLDEAKRRQGVR